MENENELAAARRLYDMLANGPDFPGRERLLADARREMERMEARE